MATVPRVSTIVFSGATGSRTWICTAATQDTAAGSSVVITTTISTTGAAPPAQADSLTLRLVDDLGNIIRTFSLTPGLASQTSTFFFTSDGVSGSSARCGTIEIKLQATKTTGGPTNTYDVETDGSPNTPPTGFNTTQLDRGWVRGTTTLIQSISNISLGGGKNSPAEYDESLFVRLTQAHSSYTARTIAVVMSAGSLSGNTNSSSGLTHDITFSNVVDNRFAAASTNVTITSNTVQNATLTGLPAWTFTSTTTDNINVDPRLTCAHLAQVNDVSFGTPPLSKQAISSNRQVTELWGLTTNIRASRGTVVGNVTSEGVNGLSVHTTLQDAGGITTAITSDSTTATKGGETGWVQDYLQWTSQLPSGNWTKTVSLTAPSDITGAGYLVNPTATYVLLASDPAIRLVLIAEPRDFTGTVFVAGMALQIRMNLFNTDIDQITSQDASTADIHLKRFNKTDQAYEFFDSDKTWKPCKVGGVEQTVYGWSMTDADGDANIKLLNFESADTAGWSNLEISIVGKCNKSSSPYTGMVMLVVVDPKNRHDIGDNVVIV